MDYQVGISKQLGRGIDPDPGDVFQYRFSGIILKQCPQIVRGHINLLGKAFYGEGTRIIAADDLLYPFYGFDVVIPLQT